MKKCEMPLGYSFLWTLVVIISIIFALVFVQYKVGQGRWVCDEYEEKIVATCPSHEDARYFSDTKFKEEIMEGNCFVERETECVKEVWTRLK